MSRYNQSGMGGYGGGYGGYGMGGYGMGGYGMGGYGMGGYGMSGYGMGATVWLRHGWLRWLQSILKLRNGRIWPIWWIQIKRLLPLHEPSR